MAFSTQKDFFYLPYRNELVEFGSLVNCVKLKSYISTIDDRCWSAEERQKSRFIADLISGKSIFSQDFEVSEGGANRNTGRGPTADNANAGELTSNSVNYGDGSQVVGDGEPNVSNRTGESSAGNKKLSQFVNKIKSKVPEKEDKVFHKDLISKSGRLSEKQSQELQNMFDEITNLRNINEVLLRENTEMKHLIEDMSRPGYMKRYQDNPDEVKNDDYRSSDLTGSGKNPNSDFSHKRPVDGERTGSNISQNRSGDGQRDGTNVSQKWPEDGQKNGSNILQKRLGDGQRTGSNVSQTRPEEDQKNGTNLLQNYQAQINALVEDRNTLIKKCQYLEEELAKAADQKPPYHVSEQPAIYIENLQQDMHQMQKFYENEIEKIKLSEEQYKCRCDRLNTQLLQAESYVKGCKCFKTEVQMLQNEIRKRDIALNAYDCQYNQMMDVVNELCRRQSRRCHCASVEAQTTPEVGEELIYYTGATMQHIIGEIKRHSEQVRKIKSSSRQGSLNSLQGEIKKDVYRNGAIQMVTEYNDPYRNGMMKMDEQRNSAAVQGDSRKSASALRLAQAYECVNCGCKAPEEENTFDECIHELARLTALNNDLYTNLLEKDEIIAANEKAYSEKYKECQQEQDKLQELNLGMCEKAKESAKELEKQNEECAQLKIRIEELERKNNSMCEQVEIYENKYAEKQIECNGYKDRLKELQELNHSVCDAAEHHVQTLDQMGQKIKQMQKHISRNGEDTQNMDNNVRKSLDLVQQISDITLQNQELTNKMHEMKTKDQQTTIDDLEKQLNEAQLKEKMREEAFAKKMQDLQEVQEVQAQEKQKIIEDITKQLNEALKKAKTSEEAYAKKMKELPSRDTEKEIDELHKKLNDALNKAQICDEQSKSLQVELQKLKDLNFGKNIDVSLKSQINLVEKPSVSQSKTQADNKEKNNEAIGKSRSAAMAKKVVGENMIEEFISKQATGISASMIDGTGLMSGLRKILDAFIDECGFCFCKCKKPKSRFYCICQKLYHKGLQALEFKELAYIHKKIFAAAECMLPGCLFNMILSEMQSLHTIKAPAAKPLQKNCCCNTKTNSDNVEEKLLFKVMKLEHDIENAKVCLQNLRNVPSNISISCGRISGGDCRTKRNSPERLIRSSNYSTKYLKNLRACLI